MSSPLLSPALLLSLLLALAYGTAFALWKGRRLRDLFAFWLAALLGFGIGQLAGQVWDLLPVTIGDVHIVEATLGSLLLLALINWLLPNRNPL